MEHAKHTPGPLKEIDNKIVSTVHFYVQPDPDNDIEGIPTTVVCLMSGMGGDDCEADARLLIAAYNTYDKHCGQRAIECAEQDVLGELLAALKKSQVAIDELMTEFISHKRAANWLIINDAGVMAGKVIAKIEGGE